MGKMPLFLRFGTEFKQGRPNHGESHTTRCCGGFDTAHFLREDAGFFPVEPTPAVFGWPHGSNPPFFCHTLPPDFSGIGVVDEMSILPVER